MGLNKYEGDLNGEPAEKLDFARRAEVRGLHCASSVVFIEIKTLKWTVVFYRTI